MLEHSSAAVTETMLAMEMVTSSWQLPTAKPTAYTFACLRLSVEMVETRLLTRMASLAFLCDDRYLSWVALFDCFVIVTVFFEGWLCKVDKFSVRGGALYNYKNT